MLPLSVNLAAVAEQIEQHLPQPHRVGDQVLARARSHDDAQGQSLCLGR